MQLLKVAAVAALICIGGRRTALGQDSSTTPGPDHSGRLLGVFDAESGAPIEGASVVDILNGVTALTTTTGTVTLAFLPRGTSLVRIQKIGYKPATLPVTISAADTVPITVLLTRLVQSLPAVVTTDSASHYQTAALRGFEERRHVGYGSFLSEAELRKHDDQTMAAIVHRLPGVTTVCATRGSRCWAVSYRYGGCLPRVFIDGIPSSDNDLTPLSVYDFAGVEYYAGAMIPAQFAQRGVRCVLLFWSRERG
jgi:hypothetical protein